MHESADTIHDQAHAITSTTQHLGTYTSTMQRCVSPQYIVEKTICILVIAYTCASYITEIKHEQKCSIVVELTSFFFNHLINNNISLNTLEWPGNLLPNFQVARCQSGVVVYCIDRLWVPHCPYCSFTRNLHSV